MKNNVPAWPDKPVVLHRKDRRGYLTDRDTAEAILRKDVYARGDSSGSLHLSDDPTGCDDWVKVWSIELHYADATAEVTHPVLLLPVLEAGLLLATLERKDAVPVHPDVIRMMVQAQNSLSDLRPLVDIFGYYRLASHTTLQKLLQLCLDGNPHVFRDRIECEPDFPGAMVWTTLEGSLSGFLMYVGAVLDAYLMDKLVAAVSEELSEYVETMQPKEYQVSVRWNRCNTEVYWKVMIDKAQYVLPKYDIDDIYRDFRRRGKDVPRMVLDQLKDVIAKAVKPAS